MFCTISQRPCRGPEIGLLLPTVVTCPIRPYGPPFPLCLTSPLLYLCILGLPPKQTDCTQILVSGLLLQDPKLRQCVDQVGPYQRTHNVSLRHLFLIPLSTHLLRTRPYTGDTTKIPKIWLLHPHELPGWLGAES